MISQAPDLPSFPFELTGHFGGFVFTDAGKRRMLLRLGEEHCLLKAPKELRRRIVGKFRPGETIRVAGVGERDPVTGVIKHVVSRVLPPDAAPSSGTPLPLPTMATSCTIRVCAKKNCWRNGGRELWDALGREVQARGLEGQVELRQVGCLDRCKQAPNVDHGRQEHARCSPADAAGLVGCAFPAPVPG